MNDKNIFDGFESVWERVTAFDPVDEMIPEPETATTQERIELVQRSKSSSARRFLPFF